MANTWKGEYWVSSLAIGFDCKLKKQSKMVLNHVQPLWRVDGSGENDGVYCEKNSSDGRQFVMARDRYNFSPLIFCYFQKLVLKMFGKLD